MHWEHMFWPPDAGHYFFVEISSTLCNALNNFFLYGWGLRLLTLTLCISCTGGSLVHWFLPVFIFFVHNWRTQDTFLAWRTVTTMHFFFFLFFAKGKWQRRYSSIVLCNNLSKASQYLHDHAFQFPPSYSSYFCASFSKGYIRRLHNLANNHCTLSTISTHVL